MKLLRFALCGALALAAPSIAHATPTQPVVVTTAPHVPSDYDKFTSAATPQRGLFTIWRFGGNVGLELQKDQFDKDYIELGTPIDGVGLGLFSGITDLQPVRIIRFHRQDDKVAILFPSTRFYAKPGTPEARAVAAGTSPSVVGIAKVLTENKETGAVVFDASDFLDDVTDVASLLSDLNGSDSNPYASYRVDTRSSYFAQTKAFPDNIILDVDQVFSSSKQTGSPALSTFPDTRNVQIKMQYNIAALPADDGYMPRLYDDRVGYFVNSHADFTHDTAPSKDLNYIIRFNIQKTDPSQRVSPAKKPVVYYMSNTIPLRYRAAVRDALLEWNKAFEKIGITGAVQVKQESDAPDFDEDDIRYNVVRWLAETQGGFAEAQLLYNPYDGEMIKSGVVIDSDLMRGGNFEYPSQIQPEQPQARGDARLGGGYDVGNFLNNARLSYGYGQTALQLYGDGYYVPSKYSYDFLRSIVLHESGHDFGLRHNFIGSEAYSAHDLQSKAFTGQNGVASSVMEYSPTNLWPKGTPQGDLFQTVLGPYDYYVIHWGYAPVAGASTPQAELPTLRHWASVWSDPKYRWSSDEDVSWATGEGIDPRNQQWDLTNDNIAWCQTQMTMAHDLIKQVDGRFPHRENSFDDLRAAFGRLTGQYGRCTQIVGRYVGGEYVSRALRGDPHAQLPLTAIPMATEKRAFAVLRDRLFSPNAWNFSPTLLRQLVQQYRGDDWLGAGDTRHDVQVENLALAYQMSTIGRFFAPTTLARLDDMAMKYPGGQTMGLDDLFTWMQSAVFSNVGGGSAIPLVQRNLQRSYAALLARTAVTPRPGTPADAQALARYELGRLHAAIAAGRTSDLQTRAHLAAMDADVVRALNTQTVISASPLR